MREYYAKSVDKQFGSLPKDFRNIAMEISLVFLDIRVMPLRTSTSSPWTSIRCRPPKAIPETLSTLYRESYTSMVLCPTLGRGDDE